MEAYLYRDNHKTRTVLARMRGAAALLIAVVMVTLLFYKWNVQRECYIPETGVDWIRSAWESLDPADAIDVDIIIDRDGAKEGKYEFVQDPKQMRVYRDMLQGSGVDAAFIRLDTTDADSRAAIVINPRSPFYNALANMDDYSSRYEKDLLTMRPWYLSSLLPVAFADLSSPIIKDTYVTRDGLVIWTIRPEVSSDPSRYSRDVLSLLSYAYLLSKVHTYHVDLETINATQASENTATQEVMAGLDKNSRDVKTTLDSQAESVRNDMYDADQKNLQTITNLSRDAADKKRKAFTNSLQAQKAQSQAVTSLAQADVQVQSNMHTSNAIVDLKNEESGEMAKALQTSGMAATILATAEAAIAKNDALIAQYQADKKALDNQSSTLSSRVAALKEEISYWRDPARLTMYTNELLAAEEVLRQAAQTLKEVQLEKDDLSVQLDIAQKREAKLQRQLSDAQRNATDAEALQSQATKDLASATGRLQATNDFLRANDSLQQDLRDAKLKQDNLEDEITAVNAKITNTQTMLAMGRNPDDINKMLDDTLATLGSLKAEYQALSGNGDIPFWEGEPDPTSADLSGKFDLSAGDYKYSTTASSIVDDSGVVWGDEMKDTKFDPLLSYRINNFPADDDAIANAKCRQLCVDDSQCWAYTLFNPQVGQSTCYRGTKTESNGATKPNQKDYISRKVISRPEAPISTASTTLAAATTSCYGARAQDDCKTCDDVVRAYQAKGWAYDQKNFTQCATITSATVPAQTAATPATSCYGARAQDDCKTCDDVVRAYQAKGWAFDKKSFAQCASSTPSQPVPPQPVPFSSNTFAKQTPYATNGGDAGKKAVYLDRHEVTCDRAINQFKLNQRNNTEINYSWKCADGGELSLSPIIKSNNATDIGPNEGKINYLERQNVDCGPEHVLSNFKLNRSGNTWKYDYRCLKATKPMACRDVLTPWNDNGGGEGSTIYLDRQDVKCAPDEALSQFALIRNDKEPTIRYGYRCCKFA